MALLALALALATPAAADGFNPALADPEVIAPAPDWSGPYVGLTYGRISRDREAVECFKLGQQRACDDPIFLVYPDYKDERRTVTETIVTTETTDGAAGVVLGYRYDMGRIVPGVDLGIYGSEAVPGVSLGLDLGRVLPYAHYSRDGAALGVDVRLGDRLTVGARAAEGSAAVMVGWAW